MYTIRKDTKLPSIKPMAVTSAHLISYNHEQDLMPLVLANCHYSFEMGVGTKIEYDFAGMERQLMDRLLYSKSLIEFGRFLEVNVVCFTASTFCLLLKRENDLRHIINLNKIYLE